jgi:hypothetical protein
VTSLPSRRRGLLGGDEHAPIPPVTLGDRRFRGSGRRRGLRGGIQCRRHSRQDRTPR